MLRGALVSMAVLLVAGCTSGGAEQQREPFYPTHCGVAQTRIDGELYYPTGIYEGGELVATDEYDGVGVSAGPTPWSEVKGASDMNDTFGSYEVAADGTAEFFVKNTDYSIRLSDNKDDAAWIIEGCA